MYQPVRINESDITSLNETPYKDILNFKEDKEEYK
jgi:hypothetical protein